MHKSYTHLNLDERITIQMHLSDGDSIQRYCAMWSSKSGNWFSIKWGGPRATLVP
jgi:hypothetical protein